MAFDRLPSELPRFLETRSAAVGHRCVAKAFQDATALPDKPLPCAACLLEAYAKRLLPLSDLGRIGAALRVLPTRGSNSRTVEASAVSMGLCSTTMNRDRLLSDTSYASEDGGRLHSPSAMALSHLPCCKPQPGPGGRVFFWGASPQQHHGARACCCCCCCAASVLVTARPGKRASVARAWIFRGGARPITDAGASGRQQFTSGLHRAMGHARDRRRVLAAPPCCPNAASRALMALRDNELRAPHAVFH